MAILKTEKYSDSEEEAISQINFTIQKSTGKQIFLKEEGGKTGTALGC